ncbi:MAG: nicotinate (nicotinamide) nucleotide adenylyltransferase [Zoogloeaceae bacterium]|jgi:nicotinate-nucleotide adenylyltransferase|nr:nicotinate (nicotinamide) nucleotide adenylyltransferase [Zoogloeaceae bacterium]
MKKIIGILGGTFDPPHLGHLALAEAAQAQLGLSELRIVPAGYPPHRTPPVASPFMRWMMALATFTGHPNWQISCDEMKRNPSYTIHTIRRFRHWLGQDTPLVLLLGADAYAGLSSWYRASEIPRFVHLAVFARKGAEKSHPPTPDPATLLAASPAGQTVFFDVDLPNISATRIRQWIAQGVKVDGCLAPSVSALLRQIPVYENHDENDVMLEAIAYEKLFVRNTHD